MVRGRILFVPILALALVMMLWTRGIAQAGEGTAAGASSNPIVLAQIGPGPSGGLNLSQQGKRPAREFHPTVQEAIWLVEHANDLLQHQALHDFKGHRNAAMSRLSEGLKELRECLLIDE